MNQQQLPLIVIAGPTAVGKTECAIRIAREVNAEVLSADSMQIYKYMDIGTAKPSLEQRQTIEHHLLDLVEPDIEFSVSDYKMFFDKAVAEIVAKGKLPLMTGGTGLYIRACLRSFLIENPVGPNWELRRSLQAQAEEKGSTYLHQQLERVDSGAASRIHPNDLRRIIRGLEVYHTLGKPISELQNQMNSHSPYQVFYIFINRERNELYQRIDQRVDAMVREGFQQEVESLLARGYSPGLKSMNSLGYRQFIQYLAGKTSLETAISLMKQETRNYAKRQLTWFRKEPVALWVDASGDRREFFGEIMQYLEGGLHRMSNSI